MKCYFTKMIKREWTFQRAFVAERNELLEQHKKKWEERMEFRRQKEIEYMKAREKRVEDYEQQLHNIRVQDAEEYNRIKIRMETDVQVKYCNRIILSMYNISIIKYRFNLVHFWIYLFIFINA